MASPDPDSRTASLGIKRRFNAIASENNVINLDSSSEDESSDKPPKRLRLNDNETTGSQASPHNRQSSDEIKLEQGFQLAIQVGNTNDPASQQPVEVDREDDNMRETLFSLTHEPKSIQSTEADQDPRVDNAMMDGDSLDQITGLPTESAPLDAGPGSSFGFAESHLHVIPAPAWNKGIQGGLRTSFGNRTIQAQDEAFMSASTPIIETNVADDQSPTDSQPEILSESPQGVKTKNNRKLEKLEGIQKQYVETAIAMAKQDNPETRAIEQANARSAGRVFPGGTSAKPIDFLVPSLTGANGKRLFIGDVRFAEHFVPLFVALNVEKVLTMTPQNLIQAFEAFLAMDYSFLRQGHVLKKIAGPKSQSTDDFLNAVIISVTGKTRQELQLCLDTSAPSLKMSAAEEEGPTNAHVEILAKGKKAFRQQRDADERNAVAIASDMGKQKTSEARERYEAVLGLRAGRVFREAPMSPSFVDFVLPLLMDSKWGRMELSNVRFLEHFVPLFVGLNLERISSMKLSTAVGAFEAYLHMDYNDHTADQIENAAHKAKLLRKERVLDPIIKLVTGKSRGQLGHEARVGSITTDSVVKLLPPVTTYTPPKDASSQPPTFHQPAEAVGTMSGESSVSGGFANGFGVAGSRLATPEKSTSPSMNVKEQFSRSEEEFKARAQGASQSQSAGLTLQSVLDNTALPAHMPQSSEAQELEAHFEEKQNRKASNAAEQTNPLAISNASERQLATQDLIDNSVPQSRPWSDEKETMDRGIPELHNSNKESKVEYGADELAFVRQYYPSNLIRPFEPHCLTCAGMNHKTSQCPELDCSLCGLSGVHFRSACPQAQRCNKCRQHGHLKEECREKLIAISGGPGCALCNSQNHFELNCDFLWRSFKPSSPSTFEVQYIPHTCYYCGSDQHFGPECGVRHPAARLSGSHTWSRANWARYVNTHSRSRAPAAGKDYSIPRKKNLSIKGRANNPITLGSDDGDDEPAFLGRQVLKPSRPEPQGKQHIKFNQQGLSNVGPVSSYNFQDMQAPRITGSGFHGGQYGADGRVDSRDLRSNTSYRPSDDSARYGRERSFSPPPSRPQYDDGYQPPLPPGPPPKALPPLRPRFVSGPVPAPYPPQPQGGAKNKNQKKKPKKKEKKKSANSQPPALFPKLGKRARNRGKGAQGNGGKQGGAT